MPRDGSGNYTLPVGNPVVTGTIIESAWANSTMGDIATQLNGVMTRDGKLGATSPIRFANGTVALPGITFASQTSTGIWRNANKMSFSWAGVERAFVDSTGLFASVGSFPYLQGFDPAENYGYIISWDNTQQGAYLSTLHNFVLYVGIGGDELVWEYLPSKTVFHADQGQTLTFQDDANDDILIMSSQGVGMRVGGTAPLFDAFADGSMVFNGAGPIDFENPLVNYGAWEIGYRKIPITVTAATLVEDLRGKCARISANLTVPPNVFGAGDVVTVLNIDANASLSILAGAGVTLHLTGTATTGTRTLSDNGLATLFFTSANSCFVSGPGVT